MVLDGLRGAHPSPLVPRPAGRHAGRRDDLRAERDVLEQPRLQPQASPEDDRRPGPRPGHTPGPDPRHTPGLAPGRHGGAVALVHLGGRAHVVTVQPDETILEAALAAGLPMPFSCTLGGCGACKVALRAGAVDMEEPNCLTPAERAAGHVLTCVGRPLGPVTIEVDAG